MNRYVCSTYIAQKKKRRISYLTLNSRIKISFTITENYAENWLSVLPLRTGLLQFNALAESLGGLANPHDVRLHGKINNASCFINYQNLNFTPTAFSATISHC